MASDLVYTPPGVYVDEDPSPVPNISTVVAIPPSRVALVGPSVGYQTLTESIRLTGTTPVPLTQKGVDLASVVVKSLTGTTYVNPADYTTAQAGSPAEESITSVTRVGFGAIASDEVVYVTYRYTDSAYYQPFLSTDWDEIQTRYGPAIVSTTGAVGSPLSLAAKIVMEQGAREIILTPTRGSTVTSVSAQQLSDAYIGLQSREDVGIVVPLPIGIAGTDVSPGDTTNVVQQLKTHVETMSNDGLFRVGAVGFDTGAVRDHGALARTIASRRVILGYPNVLQWYNGYTNSTMELGGVYLGAALAGMMAARAPQEPLTRKTVRSFSSIPTRIFTTMTKAAKDSMSDSGVSVVEMKVNGSLVVRHGVTTDRSSVLTREISIIRAKDTLIQLVYQALDQAGIIGSPMNAETPVRVRSITDGALSQAVAAQIILGYTNLAARRDATDATAITVRFAYEPMYPVNRIDVGFSINTVTGTIGEAA